MRPIVLLLLLLPVFALSQEPQTGWKPERPVELIIGAAPAGAAPRRPPATAATLRSVRLKSP